MSSKRKMMITIASLVVVVIAMIGVTIGVLAASTASVTSNINVTYTAQEVAATVSADYKVGAISAYGSTGTATAMTVDGSNESGAATSLTFTGEEVLRIGKIKQLPQYE